MTAAIDPSTIPGLREVHVEAIDRYIAVARDPRERMAYLAQHQRFAASERYDHLAASLRTWWGALLDLAELLPATNRAAQEFINAEVAAWFRAREGLRWALLDRAALVEFLPRPETAAGDVDLGPLTGGAFGFFRR